MASHVWSNKVFTEKHYDEVLGTAEIHVSVDVVECITATLTVEVTDVETWAQRWGVMTRRMLEILSDETGEDFFHLWRLVKNNMPDIDATEEHDRLAL